MKEHFFIYNLEFFRVGVPVISVQNRSFRYGDGLFETMRINKGKILHADFHFDRLFSGLKILQFNVPSNFSPEYFTNAVNELLLKNSILENAKIRLMIFRGETGIFDTENNLANYLIEVFPLSGNLELNEKGLELDVFPDTRKATDLFSNLKSNNYLPSIMAVRFAKKNNLDDAIILNTFNRICETAIANIFIIKDSEIFTPPLSEGCVAGTMRRWILEKSELRNFVIAEKNLSVNDLLNADEMFLTNSVYLLKWVRKFRNKIYENQKIQEVFRLVTQDL
ncbi:MAG: aminotransferase class IV [Ginsengibacter sp.]